MDIGINEKPLITMKKLLGARCIKKRELKDGGFTLQKNSPILVDSRDNAYVLYFFEDGGKGELYKCSIISNFSDKAYAIMCNELHLKDLETQKRVDFSYYYFSEGQEIVIYLYDVKRTFAGINTMLDLVAQWKSSLDIVRFCLNSCSENLLEETNIHFGVITKNNDEDRRKRDLRPILYPDEVPDNLPSFIKRKRAADIAENKRKAIILNGFEENKVDIDGITYDYDIRIIDDNNCHIMKFYDGNLL